MLAHNNNDIQEAVATVYQLTQEEKIRQQCEAREDYYRRQNDVQRLIKRLEDTIGEQAETMRQQTDTIEELKQTIGQQTEIITELRKLVEQLQP